MSIRVEHHIRNWSLAIAVLFGLAGLGIGFELVPAMLNTGGSSAGPRDLALIEWITMLTIAGVVAVVGWLVTTLIGWLISALLPSRSRRAAARTAKALSLRDCEASERKLRKAVKLLQTAAQSGDIIAQLNLGCMYGTGRGVTRDDVMCYAWWSIAAHAGSTRGRRGCEILEQRLSDDDLETARQRSQQLDDLIRVTRGVYRAPVT